MVNLKRSISIVLSTILILGLTACGGKTTDKEAEDVIRKVQIHIIL